LVVKITTKLSQRCGWYYECKTIRILNDIHGKTATEAAHFARLTTRAPRFGLQQLGNSIGVDGHLYAPTCGHRHMLQLYEMSGPQLNDNDTLGSATMSASIVLDALASVLEVEPQFIDQNAGFVSFGGDSLTALRLCAECKQRGVSITVDAILSSNTIGVLIHQGQQVNPAPTTVPMVLADGDVEGDYGSKPSGPSVLFFGNNSKPVSPTRSSSRVSIYGLPVSSRSLSPVFTNCEQASIDQTMRIDQEDVKPQSVNAKDDLRLLSLESEEIHGNTNAQPILAELSENQIALVHGSLGLRNTNIIHYFETFRPSWIPIMKQAWKQVLGMEPIFSVQYRSPEDGCLLVPMLHWREFATDKRQTYDAALSAVSDGDMPWKGSTTGVDLAIRFTVVHFEGDTQETSLSTLVWSVHHALIDGWSASQVLEKVHLIATRRPVSAGPSFVEIAGEIDRFRASHKAEGDAFWATQEGPLASARDELMLAPPSSSSSEVSKGEMRINLGHAYDQLKSSARSRGVTPATVFHAAWALLLGLYTDSDNVKFGTVISTRSLLLPGIFETVGPLINTLPLQIDIDWNLSVEEFLKDVFGRMQRLSYHCWTSPDNGFIRNVNSLLALQPNVKHGSSTVDRVGEPFSRQTTSLPLSGVVTDDGTVLLQYSTDRYNHSQMQNVSNALRDILIALSSGNSTLETCVAGHLSTSTTSTLLNFGNCESSATTKSSVVDDLVTLFERTASRYPSAIAIKSGSHEVTYAELERFSGHVACTLLGLIDPGEVVAVHADGSIVWLVSIYAIIRAGGAYCPLDQAHPQSYRDSLFENSTARLFLATNPEALDVRPRAASSMLDVPAMIEKCSTVDQICTLPARTNPKPWEKAYVCFSSGTTGRPKGIVCLHRGLVAFQRDMEVRLFATVGVCIAQTMSVAFDGSIHELFSALSYGATLVLRLPGDAFGHLKLADSAILTPSIASVLDPAEFPRLKTVYLVGEAVPQAVCDTWASQKALYNMYGPTEATCGATITQLSSGQPVTIGKPNPSTRIYILDHRRRLVPPGRVGELYLAGVQISQGYLERPELNAERFSDDTICSGLGETMFKTGDRGYWNDDGNVVFLGRVDRQIKLRGFRLDLEDLEARILKVCNGSRAVAMTRKKDDLVCIIQTTSTDIAAMRSQIAKALPVYAVPRYVTLTEKLPMTSTGKVDHKAIAAATISSHKDEHCKTDTEATIAAVWARVLQLQSPSEVGPSSNFARLGGHSLQQLRVTARLSAVFGVHITVRMLTELATLRDLALAIEKMTKTTPAHASKSRALGQYELSSMENEWWRKYQLNRGSSAFNVGYVCRLNTDIVDEAKLVRAWNLTLARHDVFRSRYVYDDKRGTHCILVPRPPRVQRLQSITVASELNRPFNLSTAPPVRVILTKDTMVAMWSHIICDYTALGLILEEVAARYHGQSHHLSAPSYRQSVITETSSPPCYLSFWSEYLKGVEGHQPTYLGTGAERTSYRGTSSVSQASPQFWRQIQKGARMLGATFQQLAVAAVALAVTANDPDMDITLGTPFINRQSEAEMRTVGLFLEPLPVRVAFTDVPTTIEAKDKHTDITLQPTPNSLGAYCAAVQASCQQSLSHAVPWNHLLEHLQIDSQHRLPNHPIFDCVVSFHDARRQGVSSTANDAQSGSASAFAFGEGFEPLYTWSEGAKFRLMVEFMAVDDDTLLLRLEYDTACFDSEARIAAVRRAILLALQAIVGNDAQRSGSFIELRQTLQNRWQKEVDNDFAGEAGQITDGELLSPRRSFFMTRFSDLSLLPL
jgi:amino acid adenylation domain-containing protein